MKFSLVAALLVALAVAHGSEAVSLAKRDVQSELNRITKFITDMSDTITNSTLDVVERMQALEMTNTTRTYIKNSKAKIQPLVDKVQSEAAKLQEQVKPFIANINDKIKPLTDNFNAQVRPLTDDFHAQVKPLADVMVNFFQQVMDQTKALVILQ